MGAGFTGISRIDIDNSKASIFSFVFDLRLQLRKSPPMQASSQALSSLNPLLIFFLGLQEL
jgi:hypothetical protein